jgi:hypothetical protein
MFAHSSRFLLLIFCANSMPRTRSTCSAAWEGTTYLVCGSCKRKLEPCLGTWVRLTQHPSHTLRPFRELNCRALYCHLLCLTLDFLLVTAHCTVSFTYSVWTTTHCFLHIQTPYAASKLTVTLSCAAHKFHSTFIQVYSRTSWLSAWTPRSKNNLEADEEVVKSGIIQKERCSQVFNP